MICIQYNEPHVQMYAQVPSGLVLHPESALSFLPPQANKFLAASAPFLLSWVLTHTLSALCTNFFWTTQHL